MVTALETLIGDMLLGIFGSPIMIGLFGLLMLGIMGVVWRLSFEGLFIFLAPVIIYMGWVGYLPAGVFYAVLLICGGIIFMGIMRLVNR